VSRNRSRGFHYERVATKLLSEQLTKQYPGCDFTVVRIPLSAGLMVFYRGELSQHHGDIVVFSSQGWFVTVEVKSRKRKYSLPSTLQTVKCNYCMIHERKKWFFFIKKHNTHLSNTSSPLCDPETDTTWCNVTQNEFLSHLSREVLSKTHDSPITLLPLPQHYSNKLSNHNDLEAN